MKYIVPAESMVWDLKSDWFRRHEGDVIVIRHTTKTNEDCAGYERFHQFKIPVMPGMDVKSGLQSYRYTSLCSRKKELLEMIGNEPVVILSDMEPDSLYPCRLLQDANEYKGDIHLAGVKPLNFMPMQMQRDYENIFPCIQTIRTVAFLDPAPLIDKNPGITFPDLLKETEYSLERALTALEVLSGQLNCGAAGVFEYDFQKDEYERKDSLCSPYPQEPIMGIGLPPRVRPDDGKPPLPDPVPNGRDLCRILKAARTRIARANGIPFETPECDSGAECGGSCEVCDAELDYLNKELSKIPEKERKYPKF